MTVTLTAPEAQLVRLGRRISRTGGVSTRTMAELRECLATMGVDWQRERDEFRAEVRDALERLKGDTR
jgi:hypothetical protein